MKINVNATHDKPIQLGRQGENLVTRVKFNLLLFIQQFGEGNAKLLVKRAGDEVLYPAKLKQSGATATWEIGEEWTANAGRGYCELNWYVGDKLAKSELFSTVVLASLEGKVMDNAPDPGDSYVADVMAAAAKAEDYATHPPIIGDNGNWLTWNGTAYADTGYNAVDAMLAALPAAEGVGF